MVFLYYYKKYYKHTGIYPLLIYFISLCLFILFSIESSFGQLAYFESDEQKYIDIALGRIWEAPSGLDRYLWILLNRLILNYDIYIDGIPLKLINIPFAALLIMVLWRIFKDKRIFLIPVILPYLAILSIKNLRDIPIFLLSALSVYLFHHPKPIKIILSIICLLMLILLRSFAAIIVAVILLSQILFLHLKKHKKIKISKILRQKTIILIIFFLMGLPLLGQWISKINTDLYKYFNYVTGGEGYELILQKRVNNDSRYVSGNKFRDLTVAHIRYAVTPIPSSVWVRLINGGSKYWGLLDDIILFANQTMLYILFGYLIINIRKIWPAFRQTSSSGRAIIYSFLSYWPIYSISLYGITHLRLKMPFQIVIFLIAMRISEFKKNNHVNLIK